MAKKPFAIRVEESVSTRYKALTVVLNKDYAELLNELITERETRLSEKQFEAYSSLLNLWQDDESKN